MVMMTVTATPVVGYRMHSNFLNKRAIKAHSFAEEIDLAVLEDKNLVMSALCFLKYLLPL